MTAAPSANTERPTSPLRITSRPGSCAWRPGPSASRTGTPTRTSGPTSWRARSASPSSACTARPTVEEFEYGDAWFVPIGFGHSVLNVGDGEAEFLLVHNNGDFSTIELSEWVSGGPKDVFASTLNVPEEALDKVPKKKLFLARKRKK